MAGNPKQVLPGQVRSGTEMSRGMASEKGPKLEGARRVSLGSSPASAGMRVHI